jgi:hypothetical protein
MDIRTTLSTVNGYDLAIERRSQRLCVKSILKENTK